MLNAYLRRWSRSISIGLSQTEFVLMQIDGWRAPIGTLLAEHPLHAPERLALQLRTALTETQCVNLPAKIVLADHYVRLFMVTPPHNTSSLADCRAAAAMRFQVLYGSLPGDWRIEADWNAQHPFLACALPHALCNTLQQVTHEQGLKLVSIEPHFVAMWNRWRKKLRADAWLGIVHGDTLTIAVIVQRRLCALRAIALAPDAWCSATWLPEHLSREALRLNLALPAYIQLCGAIDGAWAVQTLGTLTCERLEAPCPAPDRAPLSAAAALAHAGVRA